MALYTLVALSAALAHHTTQDPSMDLQIATPVITEAGLMPMVRHAQQATPPAVSTVSGAAIPASPLGTATEVTIADQGPKVSAAFRSAKASEVFDWLEKQDINFIVNDGDIKADAKVTLNVKDVPVQSVMNSIASALGGRWERRDGIYVFRKGGAIFGQFADVAPMTMELPALTGLPADPAFARQMEKMSQDLARNFAGDARKFEIELDRQKVQSDRLAAPKPPVPGRVRVEVRQRENVRRDGAPSADTDRRQVEIAQRDMEVARRELAQQSEIIRRQGADIQREAMRLAEQARANADRAMVPGVPPLPPRRNSDVVIVSPYGAGNRVERPGRRTFIAPSFPTQGISLANLFKSLTSDQKDNQRKRGYVRYDELSREQKAMLGVKPEGKFELKFKVNRDELTIKGE